QVTVGNHLDQEVAGSGQSAAADRAAARSLPAGLFRDRVPGDEDVARLAFAREFGTDSGWRGDFRRRWRREAAIFGRSTATYPDIALVRLPDEVGVHRKIRAAAGG